MRLRFFTSLIFILSFSVVPVALGQTSIPYMPATPQKVLSDIGAHADVQAAVTGGWGYTQDQAMILGSPYKGQNKVFDLLEFECELIELRNLEEFYTVPKAGERFFPMDFSVTKQIMHTDDKGHHFDQIEAKVDLLPEEYWPDLDALIKKGESDEHIFTFFEDKLKIIQHTYWFDITEPHNDNVKVDVTPIK